MQATTKSTPSKLMNRVKKNENKSTTMSSIPSPAISYGVASFNIPDEDDPYLHATTTSPTTVFTESRNGNVGGNINPSPVSISPHDINRIAELEAELHLVQAERDDLLRERKFWLAKVQTDNTKLMNLLQVTLIMFLLLSVLRM